jgi:hypothetical protein
VKEMLTQPDKRHEKRDLQGINEVIDNLNCRQVQPESDGSQPTENGGTAENRKDTESESQGNG